MLAALNKLNLAAFKFNVDIAEKMQEISQPLFKYCKINDFGYVKIFNNRMMLRVSTAKEWTKKYFENQYYNDPIFYNFENLPENSPTVKILTNEPVREDHSPLSDHHFALYEHNIWNIFTQYERTQDFAEVWFFAADRDASDMTNFYFNHQDMLKSFIQYFKERAASILIPYPDILITT